MECGTRQLKTMTVISGCGQTPCRCRVEQTCADCGAKFEGREWLFRDPQCHDCFLKEILGEPLPEGPNDGVDALERWLS